MSPMWLVTGCNGGLDMAELLHRHHTSHTSSVRSQGGNVRVAIDGAVFEHLKASLELIFKNKK